ncbi:unnamed protein product, partial [Polarella glacialis]
VSPRDSSGSGGEANEAEDAVSALEGLWENSRKESARRLMRTVGSGSSAVLPRASGISPLALAGLPGASPARPAPGWRADDRLTASSALPLDGSAGSTRVVSPASSVAATPRGSLSGSALGGGIGYQMEDGALSDSDSEGSSSRRSVSSASLMGSQADKDGQCPTPFGVHLEWRMSLRPRLPLPTQVSLQRGLCPGCKERLPPTSL